MADSKKVQVFSSGGVLTARAPGDTPAPLAQTGTPIVTGVYTVPTLPSAVTSGAGARAFVTDANATMAAGIGTAVVTGGANKVPVYSDGAAWLIG